MAKTKSEYVREFETALYSDADLRDAEAELKLLKKYWGVPYDKTGDFAYITSSDGNTVYEARSYLRDMNALFGSRAAYETYRTTAVGELNTTTTKRGVVRERLRDAIEPNKDKFPRDKPAYSDWRQAQEPFYTWTRKAAELELALIGDTTTNIPEMVLSRSSTTLLKALDKAREQYQPKINYGGFNFRPKKERGIRLGTVSEHGFGTAMDIDDTHNPIIQLGPWAALVAWSGVAFTEAERTTWWKERNKDMFDKIVAINDAFVSKVASSKAATAKPEDKIPAALSSLATTHASGIFNLSWELVDALHDAGFEWGAGFKNAVDLHHFEVKKQPQNDTKKKK